MLLMPMMAFCFGKKLTMRQFCPDHGRDDAAELTSVSETKEVRDKLPIDSIDKSQFLHLDQCVPNGDDKK